MSKVSVVVPVYRVEPYVERCIRSIINQSESDIEIIIVDDCSPDKSIDIVKSIAADDPRFKFLAHSENQGLMMARKTGYTYATSDYITFCDSDDYLPVNAVELLYNKAIKDNVDIVSGNLLYIKTDGTSSRWVSTLKYGTEKNGAIRSLILGELRHNLCGKLFKRELLQNYQYQTFAHFTNGEDACLFYQVIDNASKIVQIDEIVYNYVQNVSSSSQVRLNGNAVKCICILNKIRHEVLSKMPELDKELHRRITGVLYYLYSQGYAYSSELDKHIKEQGLALYATVDGGYFSNKEMLELWFKRNILGPISYYKSKKGK